MIIFERILLERRNIQRYEIYKAICNHCAHDLFGGMFKSIASIAGTCQHLWYGAVICMSADWNYKISAGRRDCGFALRSYADFLYFSNGQFDEQYWCH